MYARKEQTELQTLNFRKSKIPAQSGNEDAWNASIRDNAEDLMKKEGL